MNTYINRAVQPKSRSPGLSKIIFLPLLVFVPATYILIAEHGGPNLAARLGLRQTFYSKALTCVAGSEIKNPEGLGAFIRRNQIAFFLAASNNVPISFKTGRSNHGYDTGSYFSDCEGTANVGPECTLNEAKFQTTRCSRGDCKCMEKDIQRLQGEAQRTCKVIRVTSSSIFYTEYSGCLRPVMMRYFGSNVPPPFEYDAIHYRQGDLKHGSNNSKTWSEEQLYRIMTGICSTSTRPIVIVTQGQPILPNCGYKEDRRILAADLSIQESFRVFQYAKNVAAGGSSFAIAMMEVAKPERVVVLDRDVQVYQWVSCEKWTIPLHGLLFNFDSKELMLKAVIHDDDLRIRTFKEGSDVFPPRWYYTSVPKRMWADEVTNAASTSR